MGVTTVDKIRLAGAFGSHISVSHAGLVSPSDLSRSPRQAMPPPPGPDGISWMKARLVATIAKAERIETAVADDFQAHFVGAMGLPHQSDPFPNLFSVVAPPTAKMLESNDAPKRRRRRTSRADA